MPDQEKEKHFDKVIDRELLISLVEHRPELWNKFVDIYKDKAAKVTAFARTRASIMPDQEKEKHFDKVIDRELLISLVEHRPELWNKFVDIYKDKAAKVTAWREICSILNEQFEDMDQKEKQLFEKCVVKRWTQIRDAWVKTVNAYKTSKKFATGAVSVRRYKYHKELKFLKTVVQVGDTQDNISPRNKNEENSELEHNSCKQFEGNKIEDDDIKEENDQTGNKKNHENTIQNLKTCLKPPIRKRKYMNEVDEKIISFINYQLKRSKKKLNEDRNLTFFKSILPSLKAFDDDQTLEFQSGVINLIQTIKKSTTYNFPYFHNYQNEYQDRPDLVMPSSASTTSTQRDPIQSPSAASPSSQNLRPEIIQHDPVRSASPHNLSPRSISKT